VRSASDEIIREYSGPNVAQLKVISYTGDSFAFSLNEETNGTADLDDIKDWLSRRGGELEWNEKKILYSNGEDYFKWEGKLQFSEDNEILKGSYINRFERSLSNSRYGKIAITGIQYDAHKEAGAFYSLTVPNEIRDILEQANTASYGSEPLEAKAFPGFTYDFQTPYDQTAKEEVDSSSDTAIKKPNQFNKKSADKIINFNPSTDTLEIDTDNFGIDSTATFAACKNKRDIKKNLAKQDFDFLYDQKKGGLYFNENGADKGFGDGGIIAILKGAPDLTSDNLEFI